MTIAKQAAKVEVVIVIRATLDAWAAPYIIEQAAKVTPVNGSLTVTAEGVPSRCTCADLLPEGSTPSPCAVHGWMGTPTDHADGGAQ